MQNNARILGAELVGTTVLMLGGPGSAILIPGNNPAKYLCVALAFGFAWLVMSYVIGPVSGCHINPAVTLALWLTRKANSAHAFFAVIGQFLGAALGGLIIWRIAAGVDGYERGTFASNGFDQLSPGGYGLGSAIIVEIIFTGLFVLSVLFTTTRKFSVGFSGLVVGINLALIHIVTMQVDGTSVNPARSFGTAIYSNRNTDALEQLWVFLIFPLVGAVLGVFLFLLVDDSRLEDTMLDAEPLRAIRDVSDRGIDSIVDLSTGLPSSDPEPPPTSG